MAKLSEEKINNIYLRCNAAKMSQLLELCLDPESGITIEGLRTVHYNKIDQLEKEYHVRIEEVTWAHSQNSIKDLQSFIADVKRGRFSDAHLQEAQSRIIQLAKQIEEKEWEKVRVSNDINAVKAFIQNCHDKIFSNVHLDEAMKLAEVIEWVAAKNSEDPAIMNGYIIKCNSGIYSQAHLAEAKELLEKWANGTIMKEWEETVAIKDPDEKRYRLNMFIQKYSTNPTETAQDLLKKADKELKRLSDAEQARIDWIDAQEKNTFLDYVSFNKKHPYSDYREQADAIIQEMKGDLLNDMRRFPFRFNREVMYSYISSNTLTMKELVDDSGILTDRGYSHIKKYPTLKSEQRELPVSNLQNPHSQEGNTDIIFFGVPGSGKTCLLSGLLSLTGRMGFSFDPKGPGGGGSYAIELRNYARSSMLPPKTDQSYIQVIDAEINDESGNLQKISFIEMAGEKTAEFASLDNPTSFDDLGPGAAGLLQNDNDKVIFFVIDPTNELNIKMPDGSSMLLMQSDVLDCVMSLLSKNPSMMKKVNAIHIILTKSDTLGDYVDENVIKERLEEQGFAAVLQSVKKICQRYDINKTSGFKVGLYPFCVGKFMPGEVYTFDETDSLKILRVIQKNVIRDNPDHISFLRKVKDWFNN